MADQLYCLGHHDRFAYFTKDGLPASLTFAGHPLREGELLAIAQAYQDASGFFKKQPPLAAPR